MIGEKKRVRGLRESEAKDRVKRTNQSVVDCNNIKKLERLRYSFDLEQRSLRNVVYDIEHEY